MNFSAAYTYRYEYLIKKLEDNQAVLPIDWDTKRTIFLFKIV